MYIKVKDEVIIRYQECSSLATSSIKRVEKTLINSMFSLFFLQNFWLELFVNVCKPHKCGVF